ncbi:hypothetical protein FACS1894137_04590 [Spirochaetia bacterium]|nr:hypothetical protein FACS1894137_04590 [Spirochaetia bacterium]
MNSPIRFMKPIAAPMLILGISLFTACFTGPKKAAVLLGPVPEYREQNSVPEVIGHENTGAGTAMPEWVVRYMRTGTAEIETQPEYSGSYVFIAKQQGRNPDSLKLWADSFSIDRDFPRLVSVRIQDRFIEAGEGNPGEEFGRYFEQVVKNSADAAFSGAIQGTSFWIKKTIFGEDGVSPAGEAYEYYILTSINKEILEEQINGILESAQPDLPPTKAQAAAIARFRQDFYDGF